VPAVVTIGVFSDTHVGCSIPKAIGEKRKIAFQKAFSQAIDGFIREKVDYVIHTGDLFERRTMSPADSVFVKSEFQRLVNNLKNVKILIIRGNHDGTIENNALDYVRHPLAEYFIVLGEKTLIGEPELFDDGKIAVQGLGYTAYPAKKIKEKCDLIGELFSNSKAEYKIFLLHAFIEHLTTIQYVPRHQVISPELIKKLKANLVICGHQHQKHDLYKINNTYILIPGATEAVELSDETTHGYFILSLDKEKITATFHPITPLHKILNIKIESREKKDEKWFVNEAKSKILDLLKANATRKIILRVILNGLIEGDKYLVEEELQRFIADQTEYSLIYFEIKNNLNVPFTPVEIPALETPATIYPQIFSILPEEKQIEAVRITETIERMLEESASPTTGLLTDAKRRVLLERWKKIFETSEKEEKACP